MITNQTLKGGVDLVNVPIEGFLVFLGKRLQNQVEFCAENMHKIRYSHIIKFKGLKDFIC